METRKHFGLLDSGANEQQELSQDRKLLSGDGQPQLRLVKSETFDLCSSYNFSAASPRGSLVRLVSMSETEEAASPTRSPISASVIPISRRSEMRDAHVLMSPSLRVPVDFSQRLSVTEVRQNMGMPRPSDMPKEIDTGSIGARVRWWRRYKKKSVKWLATKCSIGTSTLTDLEIGRTTKGGHLHAIATHLKLNPNYLETGKGEPEEGVPQEVSEVPESWATSLLKKLEHLNVVERSFMESAIFQALEIIEAERKKGRKA